MIRHIFYNRTSANDGKYIYSPISVRSPQADTALHLPYPLQVGDSIYLSASEEDKRGFYRIVNRQFLPASFGSVSWPYTTNLPSPPITAHIICIRDEEAFFENESEYLPDESINA